MQCRYDSSRISITDRFALESRLGLKLLDRYGEENSCSTSEEEDSDRDSSSAGSEKSLDIEIEAAPKKLQICAEKSNVSNAPIAMDVLQAEDVSVIHYPRKLCLDVLETTNNVLCKLNFCI